MVTIGVLKEVDDPRVSLAPSTLKKLNSDHFTIFLEDGAGLSAGFDNNAYDGLAQIKTRDQVFAESDIICTIGRLDDLSSMKEDSIVISMLAPYNDLEVTKMYGDKKIKAFSLDMIPRSSRAQSMDVLSAMASIAGYRSVLLAASMLPRYFPMMITAAGSVRPAKVLILGAGVAGLQAIATAKRLGAMVEAFDVRKAVKEEVESLGAKFVDVQGSVDDKEAGGYAVEQTEDYKRLQAEEIHRRAVQSDVIIATAQLRGKKAPILIQHATVDQMKAGSVLIDLASSTGGNIEVSEDNKKIDYKGITVYGNSSLANEMSQDASTLYSNNLANFLMLLAKDGKIDINLEDDIIASSFITKEYFN